MSLVAPYPIEIDGEMVTLFPDTAYLSHVRLPPGWMGEDDDMVVAAIRERLEAKQREETEELHPGCTFRHFPGGTIISRPPGPHDLDNDVTVVLYGIMPRPGKWGRLTIQGVK